MIPLGIMLYRKPAFPLELGLIPYYIGADVFLALCDRVGKSYFRNNVPVFHFSTLFDITFIIFTYIRIFPADKKKPIMAVWIVFLAIWLVSGLTIDHFTKDLNTISRIFGNGFVVILSISYIMQIFSFKSGSNDREATLLFSLFAFLYYSCSTTAILFQDLPRYEIFKGIFMPSKSFQIFAASPYPIVRLVQITLMVKMLIVLPTHITPRKALPKWLRFRLGWRPPTEPPQYRVLPAHLVG
ncbi:hypothetical protein SAMN06265337_1900 [Hymenobacter gelipurpurascens]|uniref:Uncharacterized protein n=2 Tax=Hymenobacter gelipurpurascens TaxID=89968 RepID=A0A212TMM6_9BACT|nr:hypothetical protein SAMN06265337_1900 [Hymenobacter gelipurpurascens]